MPTWESLLEKLEEVVGKRPADLNAVIFLIGVQEVGLGAQVYTKEQKQDLLHVGTCTLLAIEGHYELKGKDEEGWPIYELQTKTPHLKLFEQEEFLQDLVIKYFLSIGVITN